MTCPVSLGAGFQDIWLLIKFLPPPELGSWEPCLNDSQFPSGESKLHCCSYHSWWPWRPEGLRWLVQRQWQDSGKLFSIMAENSGFGARQIDPERGGELLSSQVENQTRNNCRPGLIHTWEHGVELPFWEATDWQISLSLGASMPVTFRLGLFEMTACLLLKCTSHLSPSAVILASHGT